jgi:hypothetical protein
MAIAVGSPAQIQALIQQHASLVTVKHGEIAGFLALKPGHFYPRYFIDLLLVAPAGAATQSARPHANGSPERLNIEVARLHQRVEHANEGTAAKRRVAPRRGIHRPGLGRPRARPS